MASIRPEHLHYDTIDHWFQESIASGKDFLFDSRLFSNELRRLWEEYDFPYEALHSFIRNVHVKHVKRTAPVVKRRLPTSLAEYKQGRSIKDLAKKNNFPPYLFSRYLVEAVTNLEGKKSLADAMKDPGLILGDVAIISAEYRSAEKCAKATSGSTRLAMEVQEAIDSDPMYGPRHDRERHLVGIEYEVVLEHVLGKMGIPFETEAQLRDRGTSRTPDVLLSSPLGVEMPKKDGNGTEWKIVCWIDSKALFGDLHTHQTSVLPQAESYVHRFGPGLVLYWFGHAPLDRLGDAQGDIAITGWQVPEKFMLPTGEIITRPGRS